MECNKKGKRDASLAASKSARRSDVRPSARAGFRRQAVPGYAGGLFGLDGAAWLSELEGARRKPDWGGLMVGAAMVILVGAALAGQVWGAVLAGVVLVLLTGACVSIWLDEYRNPSPYGIIWDW